MVALVLEFLMLLLRTLMRSDADGDFYIAAQLCGQAFNFLSPARNIHNEILLRFHQKRGAGSAAA